MFVLKTLARLVREHQAAPPATASRELTGRRAALGLGAVFAVGVATGGIGNWLGARLRGAETSREAVRLPTAADPAPALPSGVEVGVKGVEPFITANDDFYRIDTALSVPLLRAEDWSLRIHGMVEQEVTLTWDELIGSDLVERDLTLMCVSNEVGGDLTSTARWLGLPIEPLLERAGVDGQADMVLSKSSDGWTAGTPIQALTDGRDSLLAIGMNGEPLPLEHGFPVRMVVPGLYGYVSATKWVVDLEVTRFDRAEGYWTPRGWSALGPVKTSSRIDVPATGDEIPAGKVMVAGIAWAEHRGIDAVEVRIDEGEWQPATLAAEASVDTWRQWYLAWDATPGSHRIDVRATDRDGAVQVGETAPPAPDGATGWHWILVTVT
nr:molybdopterin-dependent oxidoreductase [Kineosporia rhizophila]